MKIIGKRELVTLMITILVLASVFVLDNKSYAYPDNVPEIVSFEKSKITDNALMITIKSNNTGMDYSYEILNMTTGKTKKLGGSVTVYTYQGLEEGKEYEIMIKACDNKEKGYSCTVWSPSKKAVAGKKDNNQAPTPVPDPVVNTPVLNSVKGESTTSIKLSYTTSGNVTGVEVHNNTLNKTYNTTNKTSYKNTGLKAGKKYSYKIRSYYTLNNKVYYSDWTASKSGSTNAGYIACKGKIVEATRGDRGLNGNKAGDQSGGEVRISNYSYKSGSKSCGWKLLIRLNNPEKANLAATYCSMASKNNNIGYDQSPSSGRKELYNAAKAKGFKFDKITKKVETSCTPLAVSCLKATGISYLNPGVGAEGLRSEINRVIKEYKKAGKKPPFSIIKLTPSQYKNYKKYIKRGDVLNTGHHSAIAL